MPTSYLLSKRNRHRHSVLPEKGKRNPRVQQKTGKARRCLARAGMQNGTSGSQGNACPVARRPTACEKPPCRPLPPSPAVPKACRHSRPQRTSGEPFHSRRRFQRLKSHAGCVRGNDQSRLSGSSSSSSSSTDASNAKNTSRKAVSR